MSDHPKAAITDSPYIDGITSEILRDAPRAWGNKRQEWGPELGCEVPRVRDAARRIESFLLDNGWTPPPENGRSEP